MGVKMICDYFNANIFKTFLYLPENTGKKYFKHVLRKKKNTSKELKS